MKRSQNWPKIVFGLILIFAAQLACDVSGQDPKDPQLQDPAVNLMDNFNRLLEDIGFAGSQGAPWITTIEPLVDGTSGQYRLSGKAFNDGSIGLYRMQPQGCGQPFKAVELLATVKTSGASPGFGWVFEQVNIASGSVVAVVEIPTGQQTPSAFSSLRMVGSNPQWELALQPPAGQLIKATYATLNGRAYPGLCVELWKGGQKLAQASAGADGVVSFIDIKLELGSHTFFLQASGLEVSDNSSLRSPEVTVDVYVPPQPYDPGTRPDLSSHPRMKGIWGQITDAPVQNTPGDRSPEKYIAVLEQFDPGSRKYARYGDGKFSACNIYAGDVMRAMNIPIPTKDDLGGVDGGGSLTIGPRRMVIWLNQQDGRDAGWVKIDKNNNDDLYKLLQHLREGRPALAVDDGHVAVLRPDSLPDQLTTNNVSSLYIAQAGGYNGENNYNKIMLKKAGYGSSFVPEFYIHP